MQEANKYMITNLDFKDNEHTLTVYINASYFETTEEKTEDEIADVFQAFLDIVTVEYAKYKNPGKIMVKLALETCGREDEMYEIVKSVNIRLNRKGEIVHVIRLYKEGRTISRHEQTLEY